MYNFYAVAGINGLGVYTSWSRAEVALEYLSYQRYKGFDNFDDAAEYARMNFNVLACRNYIGPVSENFTLYYKDIKTIEMLNLKSCDRIRVEFDAFGNKYYVKVDEFSNIVEGMPMVVLNTF